MIIYFASLQIGELQYLRFMRASFGVSPPIRTLPDVSYREPARKGFRLGKDGAVFGNDIMPREHHILRGLAYTAVGVGAGAGHRAGMSLYKSSAVIRFSYHFIACRGVEYDYGARACKLPGARAKMSENADKFFHDKCPAV